MQMLSDGIRHIGDGLLEVAEDRLKEYIVEEDISEIYDVEQTPFARGKFAAVRRVKNKKTGVNFAAKFLRRRRRAQCWAKDIGHEIAVLMLCADSKHIVKLHSVHETKTETALLLELATGGELQAILDDEGELTEAQCRICMREILQALHFLHSKSIAHLDLKPQNILMCGEKVEDGLKLCDFGISRVVEEGGKIREILGTPDYVAPEVLQYEPLSLQTDIWSIGVLSYVLLTGCSPFAGDNKQETFLNISQCALEFPAELFEDVSPVAIEFIKSCLRIKPLDRMTVTECLSHSWLADESPLRPISLVADVVTELNGDSADVEEDEDEEEDQKTDESGVDVECPLLTGIRCTSNSSSSGDSNDSVAADEEVTANHSEEGCDTEEEDRDISLISVASTCSTSDNLLSDGGSEEHYSSNQYHNSHHNHSAEEVLFPDAPTTPKVLRKAPPESPPSVKALVKKFQVDAVQCQLAATEVEVANARNAATNSPPSACFVSQIPKLINSPKSSIAAGRNGLYSSSTYSRYSPKHMMVNASATPVTLQMNDENQENFKHSMNCSLAIIETSQEAAEKGGLAEDDPNAGNETHGAKLKENGVVVVDGTGANNGSPRYSILLATCIICGQADCCHQTTKAAGVTRKTMMGMEHRITC